MIGSGRCHGPNCSVRTDLDFCRDECRSAWLKQFWGEPRPFNGQHGPALEDLPSPDAGGPDPLAGVMRAVQADMDRQIVAAATVPPPSIGSGPTLDEVLRIVESLPRCAPPEPVKLTRAQFESLQRAFPGRPGWQPNGQVGAFDGVPVELVETVEESTPYLLERERQRRLSVRQFANLSPTALTLGAGTFGVSAGLARQAAETERLTQAIRAICPPEHLEAALAESARRPGENGLQSVYDDLTRGWLPESAGATKQQVAPEDPQVGYLARAFHWLFGRTT